VTRIDSPAATIANDSQMITVEAYGRRGHEVQRMTAAGGRGA
jgi:hypothetical protein